MPTKIDHTTIRPGGPPKDTSTPEDRRWWNKKGLDACKAITACLNQIAEQDKPRLAQLSRSLRLYGNIPLRGFYGMLPQSATIGGGQFQDRISYNIAQSVTDTVTAKIAKNKPRPYYVTSAGDAKQQAKAKKRNKIIDGVFYENQAHRLGMFAFRDGCICGDGPIKVFAKNGRVKFEQVPAASLKVDEIEAAEGNPRQMHEIRPVDRFVLADKFPGKKAAILAAPNAWMQELAPARAHISDMLMVRESWHLPSGPEAKDGKHVISLDEIVLLEEAWTQDSFPFAFFRWCKRPGGGFHGQGLVEQIQPLQLEVNKLLFLAQRSYQLGGSFKVLMEMGSKISPEHLNNQIGAIIKYQGTPPQYIVPPLLPPEMYQHMRWLIEQAYAQAGVNDMSSSGKVPLGMDGASGKALRTIDDVQTDRFQTVGREYEQLFMDLGRLTMMTLKDMFDRGEIKKFDVKVPTQRWIERLEVSDVDIADDDDFVLQCFPVSNLPSEPAGRLATIQEMMQAGLIDQRVGKRLMNFPDIEQEESLSSASEDYLTKIIEEMLEDDGEYIAPEPYDDAGRGFELAQQYYLAGKRDNLDDKKLQRLRDFMAQCQELEQKAMPPPPPVAPGGAPANPEPPPTSPMLPNVNQPGVAA